MAEPVPDVGLGDRLRAKKAELKTPKAAIVETAEDVTYLGVRLPKANPGDATPRRQIYDEHFIESEFSLEFQRDIAVCLQSGDPMLIEAGTSVGKSTTIKKMCAELGWEVHYVNLNGLSDPEAMMGRYLPNPNKRTKSDPEFVFVPGPVTRGLMQEEGKVKVIILDEYNAARPEVNIRMHEVLDALEHGGTVTLSEDAGEMVEADKSKTKLIALTNPPGAGFFGREPLDPAQLRRWVYMKGPSNLPQETFDIRLKARFGIGSELDIPKLVKHESREDVLTPEQLAEIPGIVEILSRYTEFHQSAQKLLSERDIASGQPQPFEYNDDEEQRRFTNFIARFYNGDITETAQRALRYYYLGKVESDEDRTKLENLLSLVQYTPDPNKRRRPIGGVDPEISMLPVSTETQEQLRKIDFLKSYEAQLALLKSSGLIGLMRDFEDVNGNRVVMPSKEEIALAIEANLPKFETKINQGFTEMLIVPFGMPLARIASKYSDRLTQIPAVLKDSAGSPMSVGPVGVNMTALGSTEVDLTFEYFPRRTGKRSESVARPWRVVLVEDLVDIPTDATKHSLFGRTQLPAGRGLDWYDARVGIDEYESESIINPEEWLILALTRLEADHQVTDNWRGTGKMCRLAGAQYPDGRTPVAYWSTRERATKFEIFPNGDDERIGIRTVVDII